MEGFKFGSTVNKKETVSTKETANDIVQKAILEADSVIINLENRNEKGELLAPNGQVSNLQNELHWKMVRTETFKKWFGDWQQNPEQASKIIDSNGEPLMVYHCTDKDLEGLEFDSSKSKWLTHAGALGKGIYFSPYLRHSRRYGEQTYFCFLNVRTPVKILNATAVDSGFMYLKTQSPINFIKVLPFSLLRPKGISPVMSIENSKYDTAEKYFEIAVPNTVDIMITPAPILENVENPVDLPWRPGHGFLNKSGSVQVPQK